ncbi:hypothetical protein QJS10_CPA09g00597 [Acorus calamus]|uniref:WEB family protein n=1 Tax=Acorus calamus TaxID=4465 RepID=A0AAV9E6G4_ACOCL|nr:hypothetical protein QJS10_CPA09g00597 [Acorus calamus]
MISSRPRSGSSEMAQKTSPSYSNSRSPASKYPKSGASSDSDSKLPKVLDRKSPKIKSLTEKRIVRVSDLQQQLSQVQEELGKLKERLAVAEEERSQALDELQEMKKVAEDANSRLSEALSGKEGHRTGLETVRDGPNVFINEELKRIKRELSLVSGARDEALKGAEANARQVEDLSKELSYLKGSNHYETKNETESKERIKLLEAELERAKESENKTFDSLISQTKMLEETKIELEEAKLEITSLHETRRDFGGSRRIEELNRVDKSDRAPIREDINQLKTELKLAIEAEEKSKKAMDDLALALKEVTTEANEVKDKLISTKAELEFSKTEAEHAKLMLKNTEERTQLLLDDARREIESVKESAEKLKLEHEESSSAWNEKEIGFINCIKLSEEEINNLKQENNRLNELHREADEEANVGREELLKLRDIMKQAVNEATITKEALEISRAENSQLSQSLLDKENALKSITRENERIRISETAALESAKELKSLLSTTSALERSTESKDTRSSRKLKPAENKTPVVSLDGERPRLSNARKGASVDLGSLKGSFFDLGASHEVDQINMAASHSSMRMDDGEMTNSDDFDHIDGSNIDDVPENDQGSPTKQKKKKALFRRFGDMWRRRSFQK